MRSHPPAFTLDHSRRRVPRLLENGSSAEGTYPAEIAGVPWRSNAIAISATRVYLHRAAHEYVNVNKQSEKALAAAAADLHAPATVAVGSFLRGRFRMAAGHGSRAATRIYEGDKHEEGNRDLN